MSAIKVLPDVYWVGAVDWNVRKFHGETFFTRKGATYNSYLIQDEKIALVDTVYSPFADEMIENIRKIIPPEKINYIIANHIEQDHSGSLAKILNLCPKAKVFCTAKGKEGLYKHYYGNWDFQIVKTGDKLSLGKKTLTFIEAPMIHWPDSMFSYLIEDELLLSNDGFGQHLATSERFDDEVDEGVLMDEAKKYYANIIWPFNSIVFKKIEEINKLNIRPKMIAPAHGVIWRKMPGKIIEKYLSWTKNESENKVIVVFETMWGSTEKMARKIIEGITDAGVSVQLFDVAKTDRTEIIKEMLDSKGYIFGSSTHDNDILPTIAAFLTFLRCMKPKNRSVAVFGSHGWGGGAVRNIENFLKDMGLEIIQPSLAVQYAPDEAELAKCHEFGLNFADLLKKNKVLQNA